MPTMKVIVVGAGAWGLPAAATLQRRGHQVTLVDKYGIGSPLSSSTGPTRIWRLTHPDAIRVRLAQRAVEAQRRLTADSGAQTLTTQGLLWRDEFTYPLATAALTDAGVPFTEVDPDDVGSFMPGLRPDGRPAIWQEDAGAVLAEAALRAQYMLFCRAGGQVREGVAITEVSERSTGVRASGPGFEQDADAVVLAAGPAMQQLLPALGVAVALLPLLLQVAHFGQADDPHRSDRLPCLIEGPTPEQPGLYAMPTPGVGYKVGIDAPIRDLLPGDLDRTPDPDQLEQLRLRVARDLTGVVPQVVDAAVCSWTLAPDNRFIIDALPTGVVVAAGDSGEGFKFSALMGQVLADLVEGKDVGDDIRTFGLHRFADGTGARVHRRHILGR